jgi:hypothetical protein
MRLPSYSPPSPGGWTATDDPAVISEWDEIAVTTLLGDTTKQLVEGFLYVGSAQAAVYDAVVGLEGRYTPYGGGSPPGRSTTTSSPSISRRG